MPRPDYGNPMTGSALTGGTFRLLQISDCHLPEVPGTPYRRRSADEGLESLLGPGQAFRPQLVLATGDLSEDASPASYARWDQYMARFSAPVWAVPGNHDDDALLRQRVETGPWSGPCFAGAGGWKMALLKSSVAKRIDGAIASQDLDALGAWLEENPSRPVLIALHHQPLAVGSHWIDRYMLQSPDALLALVQSHPQVRAVVWGHVHQGFDRMLGHARLLACPSTAANSLPGTEKFTDDPAGPACRWLELHDDGRLETGLLYGYLGSE